jgi:hypothetical protein
MSGDELADRIAKDVVVGSGEAALAYDLYKFVRYELSPRWR